MKNSILSSASAAWIVSTAWILSLDYSMYTAGLSKCMDNAMRFTVKTFLSPVRWWSLAGHARRLSWLAAGVLAKIRTRPYWVQAQRHTSMASSVINTYRNIYVSVICSLKQLFYEFDYFYMCWVFGLCNCK